MLCAPHVSQVAAVEALRSAEDDVEEMVADYDRRRRVFVKGLASSAWTARSRRRVLRVPVDPLVRPGLGGRSPSGC